MTSPDTYLLTPNSDLVHHAMPSPSVGQSIQSSLTHPSEYCWRMGKLLSIVGGWGSGGEPKPWQHNIVAPPKRPYTQSKLSPPTKPSLFRKSAQASLSLESLDQINALAASFLRQGEDSVLPVNRSRFKFCISSVHYHHHHPQTQTDSPTVGCAAEPLTQNTVWRESLATCEGSLYLISAMGQVSPDPSTPGTETGPPSPPAFQPVPTTHQG